MTKKVQAAPTLKVVPLIPVVVAVAAFPIGLATPQSIDESISLRSTDSEPLVLPVTINLSPNTVGLLSIVAILSLRYCLFCCFGGRLFYLYDLFYRIERISYHIK